MVFNSTLQFHARARERLMAFSCSMQHGSMALRKSSRCSPTHTTEARQRQEWPDENDIINSTNWEIWKFVLISKQTNKQYNPINAIVSIRTVINYLKKMISFKESHRICTGLIIGALFEQMLVSNVLMNRLKYSFIAGIRCGQGAERTISTIMIFF